MLLITGGVLFAIVVGTFIWLSPLGKLVDEFAEFRRQRRSRRKP